MDKIEALEAGVLTAALEEAREMLAESPGSVREADEAADLLMSLVTWAGSPQGTSAVSRWQERMEQRDRSPRGAQYAFVELLEQCQWLNKFPANFDDSCNHSRGEVNEYHHWLLSQGMERRLWGRYVFHVEVPYEDTGAQVFCGPEVERWQAQRILNRLLAQTDMPCVELHYGQCWKPKTVIQAAREGDDWVLRNYHSFVELARFTI